MRDSGLSRRYAKTERRLLHPWALDYCARHPSLKQTYTGKNHLHLAQRPGASSCSMPTRSPQGSIHGPPEGKGPSQSDNCPPPGHQAVLSLVSRALSCRVDRRCFLRSLHCAQDAAVGAGETVCSPPSPPPPPSPLASPRDLPGPPWAPCLSPSPRQTVDRLNRYLFQQARGPRGPPRAGPSTPIHSTARQPIAEIATAAQSGAYGRILQQWLLTPLRDCVQSGIQYATFQPPPPSAGGGGSLARGEQPRPQVGTPARVWDEAAAATYLVEVLSQDIFRRTLYQRAWKETAQRHTALLARVDLLFASSRSGRDLPSCSPSSAVLSEADLDPDSIDAIKQELFGIPHSVVEVAVPQMMTLEKSFREGATRQRRRSPFADLHGHSPSRYITQRSMYAFHTNSTTLASKLGRPPTHLLCAKQPSSAQPCVLNTSQMLWLLLYEMVQLRILCAVLLQVGLLLWCVHRTHRRRIELNALEKNSQKASPYCKSSPYGLSASATPHGELTNHLSEDVPLDETICAEMAASLAGSGIADLLQPHIERFALKFSQHAVVMPSVSKGGEFFEAFVDGRTQKTPAAQGAVIEAHAKHSNYTSVQALYKYISSRLRSIDLRCEDPRIPTKNTK